MRTFSVALQKYSCGKELRPPSNHHANESWCKQTLQAQSSVRWLQPPPTSRLQPLTHPEPEPPSAVAPKFLTHRNPIREQMFIVFKSLSLGVTYYGAIGHSLTSHKEPSLAMFSLGSQRDWIHYACIASGPLIGPEKIFSPHYCGLLKESSCSHPLYPFYYSFNIS